jgi:hypothetical protein
MPPENSPYPRISVCDAALFGNRTFLFDTGATALGVRTEVFLIMEDGRFPTILLMEGIVSKGRKT